MKIRLHAVESASRANGPGLRAILWVQGCTLGCPGCFNPGTHDSGGGSEESTESMAAWFAGLRPGIDGITLSGGEPFQQPEALLDLLTRLDDGNLSMLAFSGYSLREIQAQPLGPAILDRLDVLIAGRYVASRHGGHGLVGSANQQIHLLTRRHRPEEFGAVPATEIILHPDGSMTLTGIRPLRSPAG